MAQSATDYAELVTLAAEVGEAILDLDGGRLLLAFAIDTIRALLECEEAHAAGIVADGIISMAGANNTKLLSNRSEDAAERVAQFCEMLKDVGGWD